MSSINESFNFPKINKDQSDYSLKGKKKAFPENNKQEKQKVKDAIIRIHSKIGWGKHNKLSIQRLTEDTRSVFAVSKKDDEDVIGYATAKKLDAKTYYLSFIAVDLEKQRGGIGRNLLLRIIEKVVKKGGDKLILDFRNSEKLVRFYSNIPYKNEIEDAGQYADGTPKKKITYYLNIPNET